MSTTTKTISKSTKDRRPTTYQKDRDINMIRTRSGYPIAFKQIVDLTEIGKNKKGKKIYSSHTKHVPA